jgi:hypothetical protein
VERFSEEANLMKKFVHTNIVSLLGMSRSSYVDYVHCLSLISSPSFIGLEGLVCSGMWGGSNWVCGRGPELPSQEPSRPSSGVQRLTS